MLLFSRENRQGGKIRRKWRATHAASLSFPPAAQQCCLLPILCGISVSPVRHPGVRDARWHHPKRVAASWGLKPRLCCSCRIWDGIPQPSCRQPGVPSTCPGQGHAVLAGCCPCREINAGLIAFHSRAAAWKSGHLPLGQPEGSGKTKGFCGHTSRGDTWRMAGGGDLEIAGF